MGLAYPKLSTTGKADLEAAREMLERS